MSHMPDADLYDTIADLERRIYDLETAPRLTSASIGQGGLRVRGGRIEILDGSGDVTMTLATDGLTLAGLLQVAGGIEVEGGGGVTVGDGGSIDVEGGSLVIRDSSGDLRAQLGLLSAGVYGIRVLTANGAVVFEHADGDDTPLRVFQRADQFNQVNVNGGDFWNDIFTWVVPSVYHATATATIDIALPSSGGQVRLRDLSTLDVLDSATIPVSGSGPQPVTLSGQISYGGGAPAAGAERSFSVEWMATSGGHTSVAVFDDQWSQALELSS